MASLGRFLRVRFGGGRSSSDSAATRDEPQSINAAPQVESETAQFCDAALSACAALAGQYINKVFQLNTATQTHAEAARTRAVQSDVQSCGDAVRALAIRLDADVTEESNIARERELIEASLAAMGVAYSRVLILDGRPIDETREQLICNAMREHASVIHAALAKHDGGENGCEGKP